MDVVVAVVAYADAGCACDVGLAVGGGIDAELGHPCAWIAEETYSVDSDVARSNYSCYRHY